MSIEAVKTIDRMIEFFEQGHWLQGRRSDRAGNMCLIGAAQSFVPCNSSYSRIYPELLHAIRCQIPELVKIHEFNDDPTTSVEDVVLVCKRARERLLEQP